MILRDSYAGRANTAAFLGDSVELTCVFEGDVSQFVGWMYGKTSLTSGETFTFDDNYDEQTHALTAHLRFSLSSETDMTSDIYTCTAEYSPGVQPIRKSNDQKVTVLGEFCTLLES